MKAALKSMHSPDGDLTGEKTLNTSGPILVQLMVGPADSPGEESFDINVCTPKWLEQNVRDNGAIFGRHYLFVDKIDRDSVERAVVDYLSVLDEPSWPELADKIGRIAKWEFEDYRE